MFCFCNLDDWKVDGFGVFKNDGSYVIVYYEDNDLEICFIFKIKLEDCKCLIIFLKRMYWMYVKYFDFCRRVYEILRYNGYVFMFE